MKPAPIALNGRFSGTAQPTGTQTVAFHLFDAILRAPERERPAVVFADPRYEGVAAWAELPRTTLVEVPFQDWSRARAQLWEQLVLPFLCRRHKCVLAHHPITTCPWLHLGVKTLVTVHDLNFYLHPEWYTRRFRAVFGITAVPGIKRADQVTTVSDYVRGHVIGHFHVAPEKVRRIYNALKPQPAGTPQGPNPGEAPYLLAVGSLQPHKNLPRLIAAYLQLKAEFPELELRIVGRPQPRFSEMPELAGLLQSPGVRALGYLSEAELAAAYAGARVFCYPSLEEGFGLPLIEAMQAGTMVVTSAASCLPEIAGEACELVDPLDTDAIARGLRKMYLLPEAERQARIAAGRTRAALFNWQQAAREYLGLYEEMAALRRVLVVLEPGKDGVFDYVANLIAHIHASHPEIAVDLAYSSRRSEGALAQLVERVRARGGETVDLQVGNAPELGDFRALRRIARLARRRRPQVVHANSSKAGGLCRVLERVQPGFPPVLYMPNAYYGMGGQTGLKAGFFNTIERVLGKRGLTVNCSNDERDFALERLYLSPHRLELINNSVDIVRFHVPTPEEKRAWRIEFGLPGDAVVLLAIGRQSYQKNYGPLYEAMEPILAAPGAACFFAHAGDGAELLGQGLSPAARQRYRGFHYVSAIERLLGAADAFILPSRYEGMALTAMSALAMGPKVFLTRVPGNQCYGFLGFQDISWIEPDPDNAVVAARIREAVAAWLADPRPPGPDQVRRAQENFDSRTQSEKVVRALARLQEHSGVW